MNTFFSALPIVTALLTLCGIAYSLLALLGTRSFRSARQPQVPADLTLPGISILKPLRGVDERMYAGFVSHCTQQYSGPFEIVFGVTSLLDPAVAEVARLRIEHPSIPIQLVECTERLGPNGKLSSLVQMLPHARYEHIVVNDSDIFVSPEYLTRVFTPFALSARQDHDTLPHETPTAPLGLVTVPYLGRSGRTLYSRLEALGISTDFIPGVLTARLLERGIRFGLGSTLAMTRSALRSIGGFEALVDQLADDYEVGARLHRAGYRVELVPEIVATTVPAYTLGGFVDHQLRWARSTRDSRRAGYLGLLFTYVLPWAMATVIASGFALWSWTLLSVALLVRVGVALVVGVGLLRDEQVFRDLILLPLRDVCGLAFWAWSYASDTVLWRGEQFRLKRGVLTRI